ncbi:DUF6491 family protein [Hyphococcus flavus]|uniref:DUF6491 family protein n=1 Tax=Hyphococcus flavus TaxID=1866326 RepID=A0AAE9ZEM2_9PROT|nr:DUF6491 family protein [Hyphococcus flavus]WDI31383.1 DUF6491 family protein [Hyphococcus flavus]
MKTFRKQIVRLSAAGAACLVMASSASALLLSRESERAQETLTQYERTGDVVSCLQLRQIRNTDAPDDYTLLIEAAGGDMYLNELNGRCIGLARWQRYTLRSLLSKMCRGDIIQVMDTSGRQMGSCSIGDFEKLSKIENTND